MRQPSHLRKNDWPIISNKKALALSKDTAKIPACILPKPAKREEKALAALYAEYYPQIKRYIASRINSSTDADDLAQDVFLEFCRSSRCQNAEAYLFGMAKKSIAKYYRDRGRQVSTISIESVGEIRDRNDDHHYQMSEMAISPQKRQKIDDLVDQLPPKAQQAIKLRFVEELVPKDAAKRAGCSIDVFYDRFYVGLKALRARIREKIL